MTDEYIEVDPSLLGDSDYSTSVYNTDTTSLTSSVNEYIFENGRRYHAYFGVEKNLMPTDEKEQDRMDIHHELVLRTLEGLHKSPLDNPQYILDVGTGTGIWAIDMADKYPSAVVTGIDLSPIQPKWVPPNCRFEVDDAELDWMYKSDYFDLIHFRNLSLGLSNWTKALSEAYRCLKPGGYIELCDSGVRLLSDDNTLTPIAKLYCDLLTKALKQSGRIPIENNNQLGDRLREAGLVDIQAHQFKTPFGPWPKEKRLQELGAMMMLQGEAAFHSYGLAALTRILGMPEAEADKLCRDGLEASKSRHTHTYIMHYSAYGRKPLEDKK